MCCYRILQTSLILAFFTILHSGTYAQVSAIPGISIVPADIKGLPALQSFVIGVHEGEWLLIGGRTDGLHQRQPFAAFAPEDNNTAISVINPVSGLVWTYDLFTLPSALQEQLQSTNLQFCQQGKQLIITGGYGYSHSRKEHTTFDGLVVVDIPACIEAVKSHKGLSKTIHYIHDSRMAVTGGQLAWLNGYYYLVGGQKFEGSYNPLGPDHGPGFVQKYTNGIRKFKLINENDSLKIKDYSEIIDTAQLHRRDYNMLPQIFPDGSKGFTVFSGVFQYKADLPWLNTVNISETSYEVVPVFEQKLAQYHCAKTAMFDLIRMTSYNIFFGGISRFYMDENGKLQDDHDVPFVKTISMVIRDSKGQLAEYAIGNMPDYLGASAEFIPSPGYEKIAGTDILSYNPSTADSIFLGYIFGGIRSTADKVFWINTGEESFASNRIYKVWLHPKSTKAIQPISAAYDYFRPMVYPDETFANYIIEFNAGSEETISADIRDSQGNVVVQQSMKAKKGANNMHIPIGNLPEGNYIISINNGRLSHSIKILK